MHLMRSTAAFGAVLVGLAATGLSSASAADANEASTAAAAHATAATSISGIHWLAKPVPVTSLFSSPGETAKASRSVTANSTSVTLYNLVNVNSQLCLDDYESGTADFNKIDQYSCNGTNAQRFYAVTVATDGSGNPIDELINWNSRKCVEVYESGTANGTQVDQYTCNHTATQEWLAEQEGEDHGYRSGTLSDINAGKVMEVYDSSTADFAKVDIWSYNESYTQLWDQVAVGTGTI